MTTFRALLLSLCLPLAIFSQQGDTKIFPYKYSVDDLDNGLRLVTVPTDYPNMVALYIVVRTGSRNEIEPGKSGYAHLFEHLMFRGSENYTPDWQTEILKLYEQITPQDIRAAAAKYFAENNRTTVTLRYKPAKEQD